MRGMMTVVYMYAALFWLALRNPDRCPECGELCSPIEADLLRECYDCTEIESIRREISASEGEEPSRPPATDERPRAENNALVGMALEKAEENARLRAALGDIDEIVFEPTDDWRERIHDIVTRARIHGMLTGTQEPAE